MNNRTLLIVFLVLLGIYGLSKVFSGKKDKSFDTNLIQIDTTQVSRIVINPKAPDEQEISLTKEASGWIASNGRINAKATPGSVTSIMSNFALIKTKRIAANKAEKWPEYEVGEGQGTRIRVYNGDKLLEDFIVGRFSFNQQTQSGISYIRLTDQNEVFAIDGFQTLTFGQGFSSYRDKLILKMTPEMEITEFDLQMPDTTNHYLNNNGIWTYNAETPLDSTLVGNYLNALRNISGNEFADDFDELQASHLPTRKLTVRGNNITMPLEVTCYQDTTRAKPFIIRSNQNPESFFASDSSGVFQRLFKEPGEFVIEPDK